MKLNVGDLVELLYDGTTFSGVITAVTPERVELAFTLNIFVEGPGKVTWPNGADLDVDVGANALTKLHLRIPLDEVARVLSAAPVQAPPPPQERVRPPTRKTRTKDLAQEAGLELADLLDSAPEIATRIVEEVAAEAVLVGSEPVAVDAPPVAPPERQGIWVDHEATAGGARLATGEAFEAGLMLVSATGCVLRTSTPLAPADRVQLKFKLGKDDFDLAASVVRAEGPEVFEIAYDTLQSEVRVRMLRAVLGLAKPGLRTQESWTYQLRQKGGA